MFDHLKKQSVSGGLPARLLEDLWQDLHYALRQLRRAPSFALLVVATLAIGIGANATMVGIIDRLLFRPPPAVSDPDALSRLLFTSKTASGARRAGPSTDYAMYVDFRTGLAPLGKVAAFWPINGLPLSADDPAAEANVTLVSDNFFQTLGAKPALGAFFSPADGFPMTASPGGPAVAVISYGFWQRQFAGSRDVLGRVLHVGKLSYAVVGVAPAGFNGIEAEPRDLWVPITVAAEAESPRLALAWRGDAYLQIVARIKPGTSRLRFENQASVIARPFHVYPGAIDQNPRVVAAPIVRGRGPDALPEVRITLWLGGVSALVLLIVCANVANLLLGRAYARRREFAMRLALGAGRGRLARQLLTEALLLSAIAGAAGLYLAVLGAHFLQRLLASDIGGAAFLNLRLLAFTALVTLGTGLLVSFLPMVQSTARDLGNSLRSTASGAGRNGASVRFVLLAVQAALCMVMLVGAGLFAQSLRRVQSLDLGIDLQHTLQARFGSNQLPITQAAATVLVDALKARVAMLPNVRSVALVGAGERAVAIHPKAQSFDELVPPGTTDQVPMEIAVDSGMFRTLGTRTLRGRDFQSSDRAGDRRVAILNEPLARKMFPGRDAIGQCVVLPMRSDAVGGECVEVVGVLTGFYRRSILTRDALAVYVPLAQSRYAPMAPSTMYVATTGDARVVAESVRKTVLALRPDMRRVTVRTMEDVIAPEMRPWKLAAGMFMLFGGVALAIAMIGLYAVVSVSVVQRTAEIAVRLALGARTLDVVATVATGSMYAVCSGLAAGVVTAVLVRRRIGSLLFNTSATDPYILLAVAGLLLAVAVVAMLVPLRRALRVNAGDVLRIS